MEVKSIALNYGHTASGSYGSGAVGILNESDENRKLGKRVKELLEQNGIKVINCTIDKASSSSAYLQEAVRLANSQKVDLSVSIHFNCSSDSSANGTETLIYSATSKAKPVADSINTNLSNVGFRNRGVKYYPNLYWIKYTNAPAILIETCFVSSKKDSDLYKNEFEKTAIAIAQGILGKAIVTPPPVASTKNLYRVVVDGVNIGAYSVTDNTLNEVKKAISNNAKEIRLERV